MRPLLACLSVFSLIACGGGGSGDGGTDSSTADSSTPDSSTSDSSTDSSTPDGSTRDSSTPDGGSDAAAPDTGTLPACDFRAARGIVVIEAEDLPFTEDWAVGTDGDASGGEYIEWTGAAHNGDTSFGRFEVAIAIETAGLYRLQVRSRVGQGTDPTEHNDTWMQFPDADAFYGTQGPSSAEDRVYPRPACEDAGFLAMIEAMPDVTQASCPNGTSRDGYFKVYSSGALAWRWSTNTSDSDAHDIVMRFDAPGVYAYQLAARGDFHQLDRIVIHQIGFDDAAVRNLALASTPCP